MYVRWLIYKSQARYIHRPHDRWTAILVESIRIDGKPRQRHIACLASFRPAYDSLFVFWEKITRKLDSLSNRVTAEERQRIEAQIADTVPCPSREQYDRHIAEAHANWGDRAKQPVANWPGD
jgi:hypothetical protein